MAVLTEFESCIDQICFLKDGKLYHTEFWDKVKKQIKDKTLTREHFRLLHCDDEPSMLFEDSSLDMTLKILAPNFLDNLQAEDEGDPNATSGVLLLRVQGKAFVFAGDCNDSSVASHPRAKRESHHLRGLSIPHHAGIIWTKASDLAWLYSDGVVPRFGIVSVSSNNRDRHPREEVITGLTGVGATILCTQITTKCSLNLESLRPGAAPRLARPIKGGEGRQSSQRAKPERRLCRNRKGRNWQAVR